MLGHVGVIVVEVRAAKRLHGLSIELKIHEHPSVLLPGSRDDWPPASLEATWSIALIIPKSSPWNRLYGALLMEQHERWVGTTWLKPEGA